MGRRESFKLIHLIIMFVNVLFGADVQPQIACQFKRPHTKYK